MPRVHTAYAAQRLLSSICVAFSFAAKKAGEISILRRNFTVKVEILNSTYILFSNCITTV